MGRKDSYHSAVCDALIADGWEITHDPLTLTFGTRNVFVDLGAEAPLAAEKAGRKIAVEIKSFLMVSEITELERGLGQFSLYDYLLSQQDPQRTLYLAMPDRAYNLLFDTTEAVGLIAARGLRLLIYNPEERTVTKWIEPNGPN